MKDSSVHFGVRPHIQEMSDLKIHVLERQVGAFTAAPIILQRIKMNKVNIRRAIIREWMALPNDQRLNEEQAASFATAVMQRYELPRSRRSPHEVIKGWLLGRKAKSAVKEAA